jgi:hypothetical protein
MVLTAISRRPSVPAHRCASSPINPYPWMKKRLHASYLLSKRTRSHAPVAPSRRPIFARYRQDGGLPSEPWIDARLLSISGSGKIYLVQRLSYSMTATAGLSILCNVLHTSSSSVCLEVMRWSLRKLTRHSEEELYKSSWESTFSPCAVDIRLLPSHGINSQESGFA